MAGQTARLWLADRPDFHKSGEFPPCAGADNHCRTVRVFAVADCDDAGQVPGDLDAAAVLAAVGAGAPLGAVQLVRVHSAPPSTLAHFSVAACALITARESSVFRARARSWSKARP